MTCMRPAVLQYSVRQVSVVQLQVTRGVLQLLQCTGCSSEAGRGRSLQLVTATVSH